MEPIPLSQKDTIELDESLLMLPVLIIVISL
jgi:hypothetical protein